MSIFQINQPGLPTWTERHYHSWCPFCYLGWRRDPTGMAAGQCCSLMTPRGLVDMHVPAIDFDRENPMSKLMLFLRPRPWEMRAIIAWAQTTGGDPRQIRRNLPGLAEAFVRERQRCEGCQAWVERRRVPCRRHGKLIDADPAAEQVPA